MSLETPTKSPTKMEMLEESSIKKSGQEESRLTDLDESKLDQLIEKQVMADKTHARTTMEEGARPSLADRKFSF
jgi:hypothetical protein